MHIFLNKKHVNYAHIYSRSMQRVARNDLRGMSVESLPGYSDTRASRAPITGILGHPSIPHPSPGYSATRASHTKYSHAHACNHPPPSPPPRPPKKLRQDSRHEPNHQHRRHELYQPHPPPFTLTVAASFSTHL